MSSDPKNDFGLLRWRNIQAWAYYKMAQHLEKFGANRIFTLRIPTESLIKPIESIWCFFRNVMRS